MVERKKMTKMILKKSTGWLSPGSHRPANPTTREEEEGGTGGGEEEVRRRRRRCYPGSCGGAPGGVGAWG